MNNSKMIVQDAHAGLYHAIRQAISLCVGYCYLSELWVFGDTSERIIAVVPTPFLFYKPPTSGNWLALIYYIMLVIAIIIYVIGVVLRNPMWPIECLMGAGGCLNQIIALLWVALLVGGLVA